MCVYIHTQRAWKMCLGDLVKTFRQEYTSSSEDGGGDLEIGSGYIFGRFAVYFFEYIPPPKECVMLLGGEGPIKGTAQ